MKTNKNPMIIQTPLGTQIVPYQKGDFRTLEKDNSIFDKVYHINKETTGFIVNYDNEVSAYVTYHQDDQYMMRHLPGYNLAKSSEIKPYIMNESFTLETNISPTDIQKTILNQLLTEMRQGVRSWFVNLQTGFGKTLISTIFSSYVNYRTFIIGYNRKVMNQWVDTYYTKTTLESGKILIVDGYKTVKKIIEEPGLYDQYDIFVCTPMLIPSIEKKLGVKGITDLMSVLQIGLLVVDEAHRNLRTTIILNAMANVKYRLFLSADFAQGDFRKEQLFFNVFRGVNLIKPSDEMTVNMKYVRAVIVKFNSHPPAELSIYNKYGFDCNQYILYEISRGILFDTIEYIVRTAYPNPILPNEPKRKMVILFTNVLHVDMAYKFLSEKVGMHLYVGRYHGQVDDQEKADTLAYADIIVSTYKSFSTGVDNDDVLYVIGTNQSNKVEDNQAAGRARPPKNFSHAIYFMLVDTGFRYCMKKMKTRLTYLYEQKVADVSSITYYSENERFLKD